MEPLNAAYTASVNALAPENCRERNIDNGTIGCDDRCSHSTNSTSATIPPTPSATVPVGQSFSGPSISE